MFIAKYLPLVLLASMLSLPVEAKISVEQRLSQIELAVSNTNSLQLSHKIELLLEEVQLLRDKVEAQEYLLKRLSQGDLASVSSNIKNIKVPEIVAVQDAVYSSAPAEVEPTSPAAVVAVSTPEPIPAVTPAVAEAPIDPQENSDYDAAYALLQARDYKGAAKSFKTMLERFPEGRLSPNAYYWLGELYLLDKKEQAAGEAFQKIVEVFPQHQKVPDSMLKLGYLAYAKGKFAEARTYLESVKSKFPESPSARLAEARIQRMRQEGNI
jgi:tol-pal system protein YbgF